MDPFSAFSLASSVIQFVDFGIKLFSKGRELYKSGSGALFINEEFGNVTTDLIRLCVGLLGICPLCVRQSVTCKKLIRRMELERTEVLNPLH